MSDLEFSSVDTELRPGPYTSVLPVLQGLNYEDHALINSTYVNRIISRGKVVTLTREYGSSVPAMPSVTAPSPSSATGRKSSSISTASKGTTTSRAARTNLKLPPDYFPRETQFVPYEEFEQFPSSPWAQSPAPSPAIQADPEENPFFVSGNVDESSFDPRGVMPDYSKKRQVEAIGVDHASTGIHIPLIHPLLSQILPLARSGDIRRNLARLLEMSLRLPKRRR
jgi:hypothetical protein